MWGRHTAQRRILGPFVAMSGLGLMGPFVAMSGLGLKGGAFARQHQVVPNTGDRLTGQRETIIGHCLPYVYLMSPHVTRSPLPICILQALKDWRYPVTKAWDDVMHHTVCKQEASLPLVLE